MRKGNQYQDLKGLLPQTLNLKTGRGHSKQLCPSEFQMLDEICHLQTLHMTLLLSVIADKLLLVQFTCK